MKQTLLFLALLFVSITYGQHTIEVDTGDLSTFYYEKLSTVYERTGLEDIRQAQEKIVRIWTPSGTYIIINDKNAYFEDVNEIKEHQLVSYEIFKDKITTLYGSRAMHGVILIKVKELDT